jgi:hypothetical protein
MASVKLGPAAILRIGWLALAGTFLALIVGTLLLSFWPGLSTTDAIALSAVLVGAATFVLAALAAVVALLAYRVTTQAPDLTPEIKFWFDAINQVILVRGPADGQAGIPLIQERPHPDGSNTTLSFPQLRAWVRIRNQRLWSARQPALILHLNGMVLMGNPFIVRRHWEISRTDSPGKAIALRWEGTAIHGQEVRDLPVLGLEDLRGSGPDHPEIVLEVFAEGFRRRFPFPVELVTLQEWDQRFPNATGGGFY